MTKLARIGMILWAIALFAGAFAQDGNYRLKPEDLLRIQVYNEPTIAAITPIDKNGNVSAPFVGSVKAAGLTTTELETALAKLYEQKLRLRDPKVAVTVDRYRDVRASITGLVNRPGVYVMRPGDTVLSLLAQGAGHVVDRADLKRAVFRRAGSAEAIPIDLSSFARGDTSQNYVIEDGDELVIPEDFKNLVSIQGAITAPGSYPFREGMNLGMLISLARGEVPTRSKLSDVTVIRERPGLPGQFIRIKVDYVRYVRKGDSSQNITLMPGDLVFVGQTKTPDFATISSALNSAFFIERFFREGFFGFRFPGF